MEALVQLILGSALIICMGIAVVIFVKGLFKKQSQEVLRQLVGIELLLLFLIMVTLRIALGSIQNIPTYIFMSIIYTLFANIPIAIIAVIVNAFIKRRRVG